MIGTQDTYYLRSEVSNSDLSTLHAYFQTPEYVMDSTNAYRFGNLIDAMITEPARVDHYRLRVDDEQFTKHDWDLAIQMMRAFQRDAFCQQIHGMCSGQAVKSKTVQLNYCGFDFELLMRCKFDLWSDALGWGGDIKSTTATTQRQFEQACLHFNYDRQRAVYMTIAGSRKDVLIGISKVNQKIFKIHITPETEFYKYGMEKFTELAFRHWTLFDGLTL